jgi:diacylglycerol kinase family enzyme
MSVQSLRTTDLRVVPAFKPVAEPRVAVVLNANARRVTSKVIHALSHVVPEEDLFVSRSEMDCRRIVNTLIERRYHTVFSGGGDGTFCALVNEVFRELDRRNRYHSHKPPKFGVLKLGTGNGVASLINASSTRRDGMLDDVLRARAGEVPGYRHLDLLWVEGRRAQFAGVGVDGKLLNDYVWVKKNLAKGVLKHAMTGAGGYFSSVAFKTVPYCLTHSLSVECEVINGSRGEAYRLGPMGEPVGEPIAPGELIFRGKTMMAAAGTIPYYGLELKMFPFAARRRGMMHLRLGNVSTPVVLANLPKLWRGRWFPEGIQDFHASEVQLRFARPMPMQIAGDAAGYRDEMKLAVATEPVELVDFTGMVH